MRIKHSLMNSKRLTTLAGWLVFAVAVIVYFFSAERTGSLWDCGEFITGAYKLQVVHPPGAPLYMIIGRMFTIVADLFSDNPEDIAFSVNFMSGVATAFAAALVAWVTGMLGKLALVGRDQEPDQGQSIALAGATLVAGLSTAFATSIWFSAVEGEVYALSTFFTALTLWSMVKWYVLPDTPQADRWLIFTVYAAGLSIGVHLLSILTFPALALFFYFKKYKKHSVGGMLAALVGGVGCIVAIQVLIITGIPRLWSAMELMAVNSFGMPFHSGLIFVFLIVGGIFVFALRLAHQRNLPALQLITISALMVVIGFSTIGVIVIRANANPPINMNDPSDAMRLLPYLNREQYGERALLYGPYYGASPVDNKFEDRYGRVGDRYEIVDEKVSYEYRNSDKILFPRMGDNTQNRTALYEMWRGGDKGKPSMGENIAFFIRYQIGWMYWRYFMWNFAGRQNGEQGFFSWDPKSGHWYSGVTFLDEARLYEESAMPESMKNHKARNKYYMLPFIFGLLGLFFHIRKGYTEALGLLALFVITGIGIIVYSNQPPNEPRERDYVLVGSFFTYAIWIGMGVLALFNILREQVKLNTSGAGILASLVILTAPLLMGFQNFDDHTRKDHKASRDYAANFLNSCAPNAIIFTYGDNDTYPLWYAQEVEGVRTDVRVVNLSLIAVDWYIDQLRRKVNDSPPIKLTIPREAYRGSNRNTVQYYNPRQTTDYNPNLDQEENLIDVLKFIGKDQIPDQGNGRRGPKTFLPTKRFYLPVNRQKAYELGAISQSDTSQIVDRIPIRLSADKRYLIKDELAILDVIASNINERPVYFAVTCRPEKMFGLQDYMQMEGLSLRIVPVRTPATPDRRQYGSVYGAGRVATDIAYDNVMNRFAWGNFDQYELFVDRSYGPSVQSHHILMLRTAEALLQEGDKERAKNLALKYLEAFPDMNFPYDYRTMRLINVLVSADAYEEAKPHMKILAEETLDHLEFYESLDIEDLESGFQQDFGLALRTKEDLLRAVRAAGDSEFEQELTQMFAAYQIPTDPEQLQRLQQPQGGE
jgi:MFS family permease